MSDIRVSELPLAGEFDRYSDVLVGNVDDVTHRIPGELIGGEGLVTEPFTDAGGEDGGVWVRELAEGDHGKLLYYEDDPSVRVVVPLLPGGFTVSIVALSSPGVGLEVDVTGAYAGVHGATEYEVAPTLAPVAVTLVVAGEGAGRSLHVVGSGADPLPNTQSNASYTLSLADADRVLLINSGAANTVTVPLGSSVDYPVGAVTPVIQVGAGATTISAASGVVLNGSDGGAVDVTARYQNAVLMKIGADEWVATGSVEESGG